VPRVQVHRFASDELAPEAIRLWESGIENPEVRELILELVAAVPMGECADIAYSVVMKGDADRGERIDALDALINLNDSRLETVTFSMESDLDTWPNRILITSILRLFPAHISIDRLCRILSRVTESRGSDGELLWQWPDLIAKVNVTPNYLDALRAGLADLITEGVEWRKEWPHLATPRQHLVAPLAAVCLRLLLEGNTSPPVIKSSVIAIRFARDEYGNDKSNTKLREALANLPTPEREAVFWTDDSFMQGYYYQEDPVRRLNEVNYHGVISLNFDQDVNWILTTLSDPNPAKPEPNFVVFYPLPQ